MMIRMIFFLLWLFLLSCKTTEESVRSDPAGPDPEYNFREEQDLVVLFSQLDYNMREWTEAKKKGDDAGISFFEKELYEQSAGNLDTLLRTLRGKNNQSYRIIAAMALGFGQSPKALPVLIENLHDLDSSIVNNCLQSIGFMGDKETPLPPLVDVLRTKKGKTQAFAAYAIGETVTPKREFHGADLALLELLNDPEIFLRMNAVSALGKMQLKSAVKPIITTNLFHEYPRVRLAAIAALGTIKHPSATASLIESLKDADPKIRKRTIWALKRITDKDFEDDRNSWQNWYEANKDDLQED